MEGTLHLFALTPLFEWPVSRVVLAHRSNCRIPSHSFTCHCIRIASIVLCLDLQSLPTRVSEADQSGRVFCSLAGAYTDCYYATFIFFINCIIQVRNIVVPLTKK